jgi:PilZ domain
MFYTDNKKPYATDRTLAGIDESDRRTGDRHMLTAAAEITEVSSGARFSTRTTDLGPGGCFVDTTNPFPVGSKVRVALKRDKNEFHTQGTVVYSQLGLGMGISFGELDSAQRRALNLWLGEPTGNLSGPAETSSSPSARHVEVGHTSSSDRAALVRLVRLMITKGLLTEAEGSSVLVDPVL